MKVVGAKFLAVAAIVLGISDAAGAADLTLLDLTTDPTSPYAPFQLPVPNGGTLTLHSGIAQVGDFISDLKLVWSSYGGAQGFEAAVADYYKAVTGKTLDPIWYGSGRNAGLWQSVSGGWNLALTPSDATYTVAAFNDDSRAYIAVNGATGSLDAPAPIAGSGFLGMIAAAGLASFALRKRSGCVA